MLTVHPNCFTNDTLMMVLLLAPLWPLLVFLPLSKTVDHHLAFTSTSPSDLVFYAKFVAQKQSEASAVRSCGLYRPPVKEAFALFDNRVQQCFSECTAVDASASNWQQAQLSLKRGGGLRASAPILPFPCSIHSSFQSSGLSPSSGKYLSSSVDLYNSIVDPQDSLTPELVGNSHLAQKVLSSKIVDRQFSNLLHSATLNDRACLLSISSPHPSAWLSVTPSPQLNLHLEPAKFQVALNCKHGGDVVLRHNKLWDVFLDFCQCACQSPCLEMGCGAGYTNSQSRPADVLVPNWDRGKPAAFDLSVTSTLHPSVLLEASMTARSAALVAENRKHKYNDRKNTVLDRIALALALRARLSLPYKLVVALERDQPILTAGWFAIRDKHRLASAPQHPCVSIANGMHTHPSSWHFS
eukprot:Em0081g9a